MVNKLNIIRTIRLFKVRRNDVSHKLDRVQSKVMCQEQGEMLVALNNQVGGYLRLKCIEAVKTVDQFEIRQHFTITLKH